LGKILPYVKIPFVPDPHPLPVDPGVGFLRTLEGFGLVRGWSFPNSPFVGTWPLLDTRARDSFDITADSLDDFPRCHVAVDSPSDVFYQDGERDPEQELTGMIIQPKP